MAETFREHWLDWLVMAVLLSLFGLAVTGSRAAYTGSSFPLDWQPWWDGFLQNSGTEMLGAFLTFILLEVIRGRREQKAQEAAEEQRTKATQELVRGYIQAQELARLRAAKTPEERQPILDSMNATGLLQGVSLYYADLQEARFLKANLQGADLGEANLQGANFFATNLQRAYLNRTNLQRAHFLYTNLQGASRLTVEQLQQAEDLKGATLPDGTKLPSSDVWREAFETWCETVEMDELGFIKPA